MKGAWKGVQASLLLHAAVGMGVWAAGFAPPAARTPLVIDLTISGPRESGGSAAPPPAARPERTASAGRPESTIPVPSPPAPAIPVPAAIPRPFSAPPTETAPVAATPAPPDRHAGPAAARPSGSAGDPERAADPPGFAASSDAPAFAAVAGASTGRATTGAGAGAEDPGEARGKAGGRFPERQYGYIRDAIQQGIRYPALARRMGWEGKVVVSFLVLPDGSVRDVRVVQGSGHPALDRGAVEAVRKAAPFPRPPAEAEIITPVVYRLD